MKIIFWISIFLIFQTFIGYPISLELLEKLKRKKIVKKSKDYLPKISFIIAAHNEQKSIEMKLKNVLNLKYPKEKIEIIVSSDNSSDDTNRIVEKFIVQNSFECIKLYIVKQRKGKTNAQNEAVRISNGEILVFSDANSIWKIDSIEKLIENFYDENIAYVCGKLEYTNSLENITSDAESSYWNYDLKMRKIESNLASITAGNGAIYAIRKSDYIEINPIECHDGSYPTMVAIKRRRAIYEEKAIAYEKAGETSSDEFNRKVRMGRGILKLKYSNLRKYNPLKTGIYSYFYFCHRYLRYSLYLLHILLYMSNGFLWNNGMVYKLGFLGQNMFYILGLIGYLSNSTKKYLYFPYYYMMTIFAQLVAVKRSLLGQNKPFWEKAESTR